MQIKIEKKKAKQAERELINQQKMKLFAAMNPITEVSDEEVNYQPKLLNRAKLNNRKKNVMNQPTKKLAKEIEEPLKEIAKILVKETVVMNGSEQGSLKSDQTE